MGCLCSRRGMVLLLLPLCIPELLTWAGRLKVLVFLPKTVAPREGTPPNVYGPPYLRDKPFSSFFILSFMTLTLQVTLHSQTNWNGLHTTNVQTQYIPSPLPQLHSPTPSLLSSPHPTTTFTLTPLLSSPSSPSLPLTLCPSPCEERESAGSSDTLASTQRRACVLPLERPAIIRWTPPH